MQTHASHRSTTSRSLIGHVSLPILTFRLYILIVKLSRPTQRLKKYSEMDHRSVVCVKPGEVLRMSVHFRAVEYPSDASLANYDIQCFGWLGVMHEEHLIPPSTLAEFSDHHREDSLRSGSILYDSCSH
jgi:hypothetical protein